MAAKWSRTGKNHWCWHTELFELRAWSYIENRCYWKVNAGTVQGPLLTIGEAKLTAENYARRVLTEALEELGPEKGKSNGNPRSSPIIKAK